VGALTLGRPTGAGDSRRVLFLLRPHDNHGAASYGPGGDEALLLERNAVLGLIGQVLALVPPDLRRAECTPTKH